jgi:hypothetical protein
MKQELFFASLLPEENQNNNEARQNIAEARYRAVVRERSA